MEEVEADIEALDIDKVMVAVERVRERVEVYMERGYRDFFWFISAVEFYEGKPMGRGH